MKTLIKTSTPTSDFLYRLKTQIVSGGYNIGKINKIIINTSGDQIVIDDINVEKISNNTLKVYTTYQFQTYTTITSIVLQTDQTPYFTYNVNRSVNGNYEIGGYITLFSTSNLSINNSSANVYISNYLPSLIIDILNGEQKDIMIQNVKYESDNNVLLQVSRPSLQVSIVSDTITIGHSALNFQSSGFWSYININSSNQRLVNVYLSPQQSVSTSDQVGLSMTLPITIYSPQK